MSHGFHFQLPNQSNLSLMIEGVDRNIASSSFQRKREEASKNCDNTKNIHKSRDAIVTQNFQTLKHKHRSSISTVCSKIFQVFRYPLTE